MSQRIFDFHGGVHPPENKHQSTGRPIGIPPIPEQLIIPLNQHKGTIAKPVVKVGDNVLKGQLIGQAQGFVSAPVHASSSGKVIAIEPRPVTHPSGLSEPCIVIETDGQERWCELNPSPDYLQEEPQTLLERIHQAGVTGLGGALFPTAVKLGSRAQRKIHTLVINGAECEPYITADDMQMRERATEVVRGIEVIRHIINPEQTLIGIEDNKPEAIAAMQKATLGTDIQVRVVPTKYPSGDAKRLIKLLTGVEVPHGTLSVDVGMVCVNTGTAAAVGDAIIKGQPLISRITTLTGDALEQPQNVEALLGTPISHLLSFAGLSNKALDRLIMGGPMMGFTLNDMAAPVSKATNCLIAGSRAEFPPAPPAQACIRCGLCADACPVTLLPQQLYWYSRSSQHEQLQHHNLFDCIECGACAFVCPSSIPLVQYYRAAKGEIREHQLKTQKAEHSKMRFEARQQRLERQEAEKAAKRKANAERAARLKAAREEASQSEAPGTDKSAEVQAALARARAKKAGADDPAAQAGKAATTATEQKQAKIQLAMIKAELKKSRRKLEELSGSEHEALTATITRLEAQQQELEKRVAAAPQPAPPAAKPAADPALKKLKVELAMTRAALKKAERAWADASQGESADSTALEEQVTTLRQQLEQQEQELAKAEAQSPAASKPAAKAKAPLGDAEKKRKIELAMKRAALKKAQRALAAATEESEKATLQAEITELSQALATLDSEPTPAKAAQATSAPDDKAAKKLKIEQAMKRAALKKAERALAAATEESEKTSLQAEITELSQALAALGSEPKPAKAAKAASAPDDKALKKLKIDLAMKRAAVKKAERSGTGDLVTLQSELKAAEQALDAHQSTQ